MTGAFLQIAYRNIRKNRRRSLVTMSAIAVGFAALTLFRGYTSNVFEELRFSAVTDEGHGHLTIYKKGWLEKGSLEPDKYMLSNAEIATVTRLTKEEPGVLLVSPKLNVAGLASNGKVSQIFIAEGVVPADYARLKGAGGQSNKVFLKPDRAAGVEMAEGLAKVLDLKKDSQALLSSATLAGQMNAVDIDILGTFNTGIPDTNDKFVRLPLAIAQTLYDTTKADRVLVLLDGFDRTESAKARLLEKLSAAGVPVEIKTWEDLSVFYASTNEMLAMLLSFMGTIVLVVVMMSVVNTMGVAVLERTREIGTLRVLGLKRRGTKLLFAIEGCLLGFFGSLIGTAIFMACWLGIKLARPTYTPPGFSEEVPLVVDLVPGFLLIMTGAMVIFALVAALLPAAKAARQHIVDSLGHV